MAANIEVSDRSVSPLFRGAHGEYQLWARVSPGYRPTQQKPSRWVMGDVAHADPVDLQLRTGRCLRSSHRDRRSPSRRPPRLRWNWERDLFAMLISPLRLYLL